MHTPLEELRLKTFLAWVEWKLMPIGTPGKSTQYDSYSQLRKRLNREIKKQIPKQNTLF